MIRPPGDSGAWGLPARELRAERYDQQHRQVAHALDGEVEQFARGRVDPVGVLQDHEHRLPGSEHLELTQ